ncbi:hypothetical protein AVO45_05055 [Ruegeria marisrubri]|uniref:YjiS-like domain-containing protein n=1 Tax=Ruegeria marisrubri TaxID=1685379 RepID=A0A0X3TXN6_9RHOB|nr:DUF1127 domain-containing protein [Ruegeria marisrubri]KUJ80422.1 hypothetical protein AVO45_05055 [Ruegeria marisrubri]
MAALDTTRATTGSFGFAGRIGAFFASIVNAIVEWNDARATRNALSSLTDRELEDIGLCRGDIEAVAAGGR